MNEQSFFQLTQDAVTSLAERYGTPLLVLSLEQVEKNYDILREHIPQLKIHYAMKANPDLHILDLLINKGACFDVASDGEIRTLSQLGVSGDRMIYANPIKLDAGFRACNDAGVYRMTYDSESEIRKIAEHCPGATVLLRLRIDNAKAHVDLNKKFGCPREKALDLMLKAKEAGLDVAGIAFHVGSQTVSADPYFHAMDITRELMAEARARGLSMRVLDIGGGTADIAVISLGGTVVSTSIKVAGDDFDEALVRYMRKKHNLLIGDRTAEDIKIQVGSAYTRAEESSIEVRGRNLVTGLPKTVTVTSEETREALREATAQIVEAVHSVLERTPPELAADISDRGIVLTGGGSMLQGLEQLIEEKTGITTMTADDPMTAVAIGTGQYIEYLGTK